MPGVGPYSDTISATTYGKSPVDKLNSGDILKHFPYLHSYTYTYVDTYYEHSFYQTYVFCW